MVKEITCCKKTNGKRFTHNVVLGPWKPHTQNMSIKQRKKIDTLQIS